MIILSTAIEQTFSIIPKRFFNPDNEDASLLIEDETTKNVFLYNLFGKVSTVNDITNIRLNLTNVLLKENTFYIFTIALGENADEIIYKDIVFCTNQNNYTINDNSYVLPTINNNDYITI